MIQRDETIAGMFRLTCSLCFVYIPEWGRLRMFNFRQQSISENAVDVQFSGSGIRHKITGRSKVNRGKSAFPFQIGDYFCCRSAPETG